MLHEILMALAGCPGDVILCDELRSPNLLSRQKSPVASSNRVYGSLESKQAAKKAPKKLNGFYVNPRLTFLSAGEREVLNSIISIGFDYYVVQKFIGMVRSQTSLRTDAFCSLPLLPSLMGIDVLVGGVDVQSSSRGINGASKDEMLGSLRASNSNAFSQSGEVELGEDDEILESSSDGTAYGLYATAMVSGIERVNHSYMAKLCALEKEVIADPSLPLSHILITLRKETVELKALHTFIEKYSELQLAASASQVENDAERGAEGASLYSLSGGVLLDSLWQGCSSGNPVIHELHKKLFLACAQVFISQISGWMFYGQLSDPYNEFFVKRNIFFEDPEAKKLEVSTFLYDDTNALFSEKALNFEWNSLFKFVSDAIPTSLLSLASAKKVFFIGKVVRVLNRCNRWTGAERDDSTKQIVAELKKSIEASSPASKLGYWIEELRAKMTKLLWKLILTDGHLLPQLAFLRNFFLLGNGLFFELFFSKTSELALLSRRKTSQDELKGIAWSEAVQYMEDIGNVTQSFPANDGVKEAEGGVDSFDSAKIFKEAPFDYLKLLPTLLRNFKLHSSLRYFEFTRISSGVQDSKQKLILGGSASLSEGRIALGPVSASSSSSSSPGVHISDLAVERSAEITLGCCLPNSLYTVANGFKHEFDSFIDWETGVFQHKNSGNLLSSSRGCRLAVVFQNELSPYFFENSVNNFQGSFWPNIEGCVAVELCVRIEPQAVEDSSAGIVAGQSSRNVEASTEVIWEVTVDVALYAGDDSGLSSFYSDEASGSLDITEARKAEAGRLNGADGVASSRCTYIGTSHLASNRYTRHFDEILSQKEEGGIQKRRSRQNFLLKSGKRRWLLRQEQMDMKKLSFEDVTLSTAICLSQKEFTTNVDFFVAGKYVPPVRASGVNTTVFPPIIYLREMSVLRDLFMRMEASYIGLFTIPLSYRHRIFSPAKDKLQSQKRSTSNFKKVNLCDEDASSDRTVYITRWMHSSFSSSFELQKFEDQMGGNQQLPSEWRDLRVFSMFCWPCPLIVSSENLITYNSLFQYLLLLKRSHVELQDTWLLGISFRRRSGIRSKTTASSAESFDDALMRFIFLLRSRFYFFISQIISYFQMNVLEAEFKMFTSTLAEAEGYEDAKSLHDAYVSQISTKCFLGISALLNPMMKIIHLVFKFCTFLRGLKKMRRAIRRPFPPRESVEIEVPNATQEKSFKSSISPYSLSSFGHDEALALRDTLLKFVSDFSDLCEELTTEISAISQGSSYSHLGILLLSLDFNGFLKVAGK